MFELGLWVAKANAKFYVYSCLLFCKRFDCANFYIRLFKQGIMTLLNVSILGFTWKFTAI